MSDRIVITGMGAVTPCGIGVDEFWAGLVKGESAVGKISSFDASSLPVQIAAEIKDFDPLKYMDKKHTRELAPFMQYAFAAATEAMEDAGIAAAPEDRNIPGDRIGISFGTAFAGFAEIAETQDGISRGEHSKVSPRFVPKVIGNIAAAQIAIAKGFTGPSMTVTTACSSGADAITNGAMLLKSGDADVMLCVGAEAATCALNILGLSGAHALSTANEMPQKASRPFDEGRNGFVMGEGGGAIIIETEEHARARGAKIHAVLLSCANSTDGYHVTSPHPDGIGAIQCMESCIRKAGLSVSDVDYINAHGTSTPVGDVIETRAIHTLFGEHAGKLMVSSTKGTTGHMMGAGGVTEVIACVKSIEEGIVPPTANLETPDDKCDLDYVPLKARKADVKVAMSNAFGFGGQNSSILVGRYE